MDRAQLNRRCKKKWQKRNVRNYWCRKRCSELLLREGTCFGANDNDDTILGRAKEAIQEVILNDNKRKEDEVDDDDIPDWIPTMIEKFSNESVTHVKRLTHNLNDPQSAFKSWRHEDAGPDIWKRVSDSVYAGSQGKEKYCTLYRDNWSCEGPSYESFLSQLSYNRSMLDFGNALRENSRLYLQGNSLIAQLGTSIICNTRNILVWQLGGSSYLAYHPKKNSTVVVFGTLMSSSQEELSIIQRVGYNPDYIVSGFYTSWVGYPKAKNCTTATALAHQSRQFVLEQFPKANYLELFDLETLSGNSCCAEFSNCKDISKLSRSWCHGCVPGPINLVAEKVIQWLMKSPTAKETIPVHQFDNTLGRFGGTSCDMS